MPELTIAQAIVLFPFACAAALYVLALFGAFDKD